MYSREIERKSVKCPFCGVINIPEYLFLKNVERSDFLNVFTQCTNPTCRNMFITQFSTVGVRKPVFTKNFAHCTSRKKEPLVTLYLNYLQIFVKYTTKHI